MEVLISESTIFTMYLIFSNYIFCAWANELEKEVKVWLEFRDFSVAQLDRLFFLTNPLGKINTAVTVHLYMQQEASCESIIIILYSTFDIEN